ncbi:MAG TPA: DUF3616 domain-containing protein [Candidatus Limnocylindria bacterium]|nr:DUF3616 domain-containing protein [Candidatus Limnocylindria bacterium]
MLGLTCLSCRAEHLVQTHSGLANASAAVPVGANLFLTGADDDNVIKLYRTDASDGPLLQFDPSPWLQLEGRSRDVNIEGAARVGDLVYWLGSHGRNKDGRPRPNRQRLFATQLSEGTNGPSLSFVGQPCLNLLEALVAAPQLAPFHLRDASRRPTEDGKGLNFEGLSAMPDGGLLLGFRAPVPEGRALLVPLLNPSEVIHGGVPRLGQPIQLDLGGLGIRDLAWSGQEYFVLAGPKGSGKGGNSQLWRWAGGEAKPELLDHPVLRKLNPEGIAIFGPPEKPHLLIVSDDGNRTDGTRHTASSPSFRSVWLKP